MVYSSGLVFVREFHRLKDYAGLLELLHFSNPKSSDRDSSFSSSPLNLRFDEVQLVIMDGTHYPGFHDSIPSMATNIHFPTGIFSPTSKLHLPLDFRFVTDEVVDVNVDDAHDGVDDELQPFLVVIQLNDPLSIGGAVKNFPRFQVICFDACSLAARWLSIFASKLL